MAQTTQKQPWPSLTLSESKMGGGKQTTKIPSPLGVASPGITFSSRFLPDTSMRSQSRSHSEGNGEPYSLLVLILSALPCPSTKGAKMLRKSSCAPTAGGASSPLLTGEGPAHSTTSQGGPECQIQGQGGWRWRGEDRDQAGDADRRCHALRSAAAAAALIAGVGPHSAAPPGRPAPPRSVPCRAELGWDGVGCGAARCGAVGWDRMGWGGQRGARPDPARGLPAGRRRGTAAICWAPPDRAAARPVCPTA